MLVATTGTPLIGPGTGVIGNPPLSQLPARPNVTGLPVAIVGDPVLFTYNDERGTQMLSISSIGASLYTFVGGTRVALQGTALSDPSVSIGVPPQTILSAI